MKILSWNVNGLRSVYKKRSLDWFHNARPEILCLQETKLQEDQLPEEIKNLSGYFSFFNSATKKGYSGVAVFSKTKPEKVINCLGHLRFDQEGRFLQLEFPDFTLINLYLPHGGRGKENLSYKLEVYDHLLKYLEKTLLRRPADQGKLVLIGDFNIAHQEIDLARPRQNKNNIMFTPEERKQIDKIIDLGFTDTFRKSHPEGGNYTWWPYFLNARERNLGWRIDYAFTSKALTPKVKNALILSKTRGSDHCPMGIEIEI